MNNLKFKSLDIARSGIKVLDETQGICEMVVSVFGNRDSYNERMLLGCYAKSLTQRSPTGLFQHNWELPVAKTLEAKELKPGDPSLPQDLAQLGGLYIRAQYNLDTQRGRDAFSDIQKGIINEFSVGYREIKALWNKELDCKDVTEAFLYEWSSVVAGANPLTEVISAKDARGTAAGAELFERTKSEYLGDDAEEDMTYAGMCQLGYKLMWDVGYACVYGESLSKADRCAMLEAAAAEYGQLCSKLMQAMLPESDQQDPAGYAEMRAEVERHKTLLQDDTSLLNLRDGEVVLNELQALLTLGERAQAKLSVIGELRAQDRKKEGRMFSDANCRAIKEHTGKLRDMADSLETMVDSAAKPKKQLNFQLLMKVKSYDNV